VWLPHVRKLANGRVNMDFAGAMGATDTKRNMQVAKQHALAHNIWTQVVRMHSSRSAASERKMGMGAHH